MHPTIVIRHGLASGALSLLAACSSFHLPFTKSSAANEPPSAAALQIEAVKNTIARARMELTTLEANTALAARVPAEIKDAEEALKTADSSKYDALTGAHQVYVADHKVQLAKARAEARQLSADLETLRSRRDQLATPGSP